MNFIVNLFARNIIIHTVRSNCYAHCKHLWTVINLINSGRPITNKYVLITHIIRILICVNRMQFVLEFQNRGLCLPVVFVFILPPKPTPTLCMKHTSTSAVLSPDKQSSLSRNPSWWVRRFWDIFWGVQANTENSWLVMTKSQYSLAVELEISIWPSRSKVWVTHYPLATVLGKMA